ncbi:MAG: hypothetical protein HQ506_07720 [Candidatus Marinimicrobia bacterium]|nr:hypothetical protein [Candidatus Neomarinimicrobiota bacterium]
MKQTLSRTRIRKLSSWFAFLLIFAFISSTHAAEWRWIKIGSLHNFYQAIGSEPEEDVGAEQQFGMRWNAFYDHQDMQAAKGMWIAVANYEDPLANTTFNYKIAHCGPRPRPEISANEFMPTAFGMTGRFAAPTIIVDGELASDLDWDDVVDDGGFDINQRADRQIYNSVNTSTGISFDRNVYAFSQQYYDNFFIYEYTFVNTGAVSQDESISHSNTLEGVYFHWQFRNAVAGEGTVEGSVIDYRGRRGWGTPQNCRWGMNTMNDVIGENPDNPTTTSMFSDELGEMGIDEYDIDGEIMRAFYSWHGRHSTLNYDNIGSPNIQGYQADGLMGASQFMGSVVLHADTSPQNSFDDIYQPTTTRKIESNDPETVSNDQFSSSRMERGYTQFVAAGHEPLSQAEQVKSQGQFPDQFSTAGGYSQTWSFGPYTMAPGDTVRIVVAEGVAGLSRAMNQRIGNNWYKFVADGQQLDVEMPDGSPVKLTSEAIANDYKNAWVYSGRDSLMETFRRARFLYKNGLDMGSMTPPEPPAAFEVTSQGNRIYLTWADNAPNSSSNFEGYKIFRAKGQFDSTYYEIADLNETDGSLAHEFSDMTAERGQLYFYYIISYDDGSTNVLEPNIPLHSSPFFTRTNKGASMLKPPAEGIDDIIIVPNPYVIANNQLQYIGEQNSIKFWNLPAACEINIFTERGDKIYTYDHVGSGVATWNLLTTSKQMIVSGVYIVVFETPDGDKSIKKFVVIR